MYVFLRQRGWLQFWYTDETADRVAKEMVRVANGGSIACMACPSLFRKLREKHPEQKSRLFEFDTRFEVKPFAQWALCVRELLGSLLSRQLPFEEICSTTLSLT